MKPITPSYFYIAHVQISHPLLIQKIVDQLLLFKIYDPKCQLARTITQNSFLTLIVTSDNRIPNKAIAEFEQSVPFIEGVMVLFTHKTTDADKNGQNFPPTYVYSAYYSLGFSWLSELLGKVYFFELSLRKVLKNIKGGSYYLYVNPSYMALILESTTPFQDGALDNLFTKLEKGTPTLLTSFSSFPSTPAS